MLCDNSIAKYDLKLFERNVIEKQNIVTCSLLVVHMLCSLVFSTLQTFIITYCKLWHVQKQSVGSIRKYTVRSCDTTAYCMRFHTH